MAKKPKPSDSDIQNDPNALRDAILAAALPHVPFDGWTRAAAIHGAEDIGLDATAARRAFPGGARDMIPWHSRMADRRMMDALAKMDLPSMRVRDRVTTAVIVRLDQNAADREVVRKALAYLALPQNAGLAAHSLYRTVDDMWFAAGDTATDWNFYSKRALLAGVYSSTLLVWLNDKSEDFADTRAFLDRRIENVMQIPKATARLRDLATCIPRRVRAFRAYRTRTG